MSLDFPNTPAIGETFTDSETTWRWDGAKWDAGGSFVSGSVSLPIAAVYGGTGITAYAQGDLLYASAAAVLAKLPKNVIPTRYLSNTGAANNPSWGQIDLSNGVTGVLPLANGGSGSATGSAWVLKSGDTVTGKLAVQDAATVNTANGASLRSSNDASYTADTILAHGFLATPGSAKVFSTHEAVLHAQSAVGMNLVVGLGSYCISEVSSGGGFPATVGLFSTVVANANNAHVWGLNTLMSDSSNLGVVPGVGRFLCGAELDFNVTSPYTAIFGLQLAGSSHVQPAPAHAIMLQPLDSPNYGTVARWTDFLWSENGATDTFATIGAKQNTGVSIKSQDLRMQYRNSGGTQAELILTVSQADGLEIYAGDPAARAVSILNPGGFFNVGDNGGFSINSRIVMAGSDATFAVGSNTGFTTQSYGNASAGTTVYGSIVSFNALNTFNFNRSIFVSSSGVGYGLALTTPVNTNSSLSLNNGNRDWQLVALGTSTPGTFWIFDATAGATRLAIDPTGVCFNTSGTWTAISDIAVKRNVTDYQRGLADLVQLRPVSYRFNGVGGTVDDGIEQFGLIAQEVEPFVPEVVGTRGWAPLPADPHDVDNVTPLLTLRTVDPGRLIYACINAIKELNARLEQLEGAS